MNAKQWYQRSTWGLLFSVHFPLRPSTWTIDPNSSPIPSRNSDLLAGVLALIQDMYNNVGTQPGVPRLAANPQLNPFGNAYYGAGSGLIRGERMEIARLDETLKVLTSSLNHIKWRLKSSAKRRLETDILALCTGMRPVVMVDYGGKMPELQDRLCGLLQLCQKESPIFEHLRIMVIEDMIYLIHAKGLAEHVRSSLSLEARLLFVDLEHDPPKMISQAEKCSLGMQLISVQKMFSSSFPLDGMNNPLLTCQGAASVASTISLINEPNTSQCSGFIDLSSCMQETQVTIPTLNGWLLGYPLVYLFGKEHIADAVYNLSTKSLRVYKILICRNVASDKKSQQDELMSFSVPYDLSMGGSNEPWAEAFLSHMQAKWEACKPCWKSLQMEVSECYPQAIAL